MRIEDSRRLTGFNLLSPRAGAICDVRFGPDEPIEARLAAWSQALDRVFDALGWSPMPRWTTVVIIETSVRTMISFFFSLLISLLPLRRASRAGRHEP